MNSNPPGLPQIINELTAATNMYDAFLAENKKRFDFLREKVPTGDVVTDYCLAVSNTPQKAARSYPFLNKLSEDMQTNRGEIIGIFDQTSSGGVGPVVYATHTTIGKVPEAGKLMSIRDDLKRQTELVLAIENMVRCEVYPSRGFSAIEPPDVKIAPMKVMGYPLYINFVGGNMHVYISPDIHWHKSEIKEHVIGEEKILEYNQEIYPHIPDDALKETLKMLEGA